MIHILLASVLLCGGFIATALAQTALLQRRWETGREHHLRYESVQQIQPLRLGKKLGSGPTCRVLNEFSLTAWPKPEGGQFYGQRWLVNAIETKAGREVRGFDSRAMAKSKNYDATFAQAWEARRGAVFYTDGTAEGQAGAGYLAHGFATDFPSPVVSLTEYGAPVRHQLVALPGAPAEPVGAGHLWTARVQGRLRGALVETTATFRFERLERLEGRSCAVVKVDAVFAEVPDPVVKATLEAARKLSPDVPDPASLPAAHYVRASLDGEVWLDTATGVAVREKTTAKMLTTPAEDGGHAELVDTDEMTLVAIKPVDPAQPPPDWRSRGEVAAASPAAAAPAPPAAGPRAGAIPLATRWQPGMRYVHGVRDTMEGIQTIPAMKQTFAQSHLREGETETLVSPAATPGEIQLTTRHLHLVIQTSVNKQKMSFDSRKAGSKANPMEALGAMEAKMVFVSRVDAAGEIKDAKVEGLPAVSPAGFSGRPPEPWKEPLPWIGPMPTGHRAPGERWTAKFISRQSGCGEVESDQQWTFARMETVAGRECAVLEVAATLTDLQGQPAKPRVDDALLEKGQVEAAIWIEPATSTVVRWKTKADLRVQYAAPGAPNSGWRIDSVQTRESTLLSMGPAEPALVVAAVPVATPTPPPEPSPPPASTAAKTGVSAWLESDDPKMFTLGFYKWYYGRIRELKNEWPIVSKRADIRRVIAACVAPEVVRRAAQFIKTDGAEGAIPFAPGNDGDNFWGDRAVIRSMTEEGDRLRIAVFMKGTSKGYENFHANDTVLLEKRAAGWIIVENSAAPEAAPSAPPPPKPAATAAAGGFAHLAPSLAFGVVVKKAGGEIVKADLVALPAKKVLRALVEPGSPVQALDLQWNNASTQVAVTRDLGYEVETKILSVAGGAVTAREVPEFDVPIFKKLGDNIRRVRNSSRSVRKWTDDETLLLSAKAQLVIKEGSAKPYRIDYEYEVTVFCPPRGALQIRQVREVSVKKSAEVE